MRAHSPLRAALIGDAPPGPDAMLGTLARIAPPSQDRRTLTADRQQETGLQPLDIATFAAALFAFALVSGRVQAGFVTPPMAFSLFGVVAGADGLGLLQLPLESGGLDALAEITLTLILFTDASRIDLTRLGREHTLPVRMLGIGLPLTVAAGAAAAWLMFPGIGLASAALLAAILAPTDAALGQAVVNDTRTPIRIRQALNVESGLNDGLAFPAVLVFLSLTGGGEGRGMDEWALFIALQLGIGPLAGVAVGRGGGWAAERMTDRGWMNGVFLRMSALALALLAWALAELLHGNGFIAAFTAGLMAGIRSDTLRASLEDFGEVEAQLLSLVVFIAFGATMLPAAIAGIDWSILAYALLSLTLVRMLPVWLSLLGTRLAPVSRLYLGWFGPRGLASILYLLLIVEEADLAPGSTVYDTIIVTVGLSILLHGASARPLAGAYARAIAGEGPEHRPVTPFATRPSRRARARADTDRADGTRDDGA